MLGILVVKRSEEELGGREDRECDSSGKSLLFIPGDAPLSSVSLASGMGDLAASRRGCCLKNGCALLRWGF